MDILKAKLKLLELHYKNKAPHLGSNLSCIDIIMNYHHNIMKPGDKFILSKGHSAAALYVTKWSLGELTDADLNTFYKDGSNLGGHVDGSGSLGHGLSIAAGWALFAKHGGSKKHFYCLCSDGDFQEGSTWEALSFIAHHQLTNITVLIDLNRRQGFGRVIDIIRPSPLVNRLKSYNLRVEEVMNYEQYPIDRVVIFYTTKGYGLSLLEDTFESHYHILTEKEYKHSIQELKEQYEEDIC